MNEGTRKFMRRLYGLLGLEWDNSSRFVLDWRPGHLPKVYVEYIPDDLDAERLDGVEGLTLGDCVVERGVIEVKEGIATTGIEVEDQVEPMSPREKDRWLLINLCHVAYGEIRAAQGYVSDGIARSHLLYALQGLESGFKELGLDLEKTQ